MFAHTGLVCMSRSLHGYGYFRLCLQLAAVSVSMVAGHYGQYDVFKNLIPTAQDSS